MFVQSDDFAIENRPLGGELFWQLRKFGILRGHLDLISRNKSQASIVEETNGSKTVPLRFEDPFRIREWFVDECRQHRLDDGRHACFACARAVDVRGFLPGSSRHDYGVSTIYVSGWV